MKRLLLPTILLLLLGSLTSTTCNADRYWETIFFTNNSNEDIYVVSNSKRNVPSGEFPFRAKDVINSEWETYTIHGGMTNDKMVVCTVDNTFKTYILVISQSTMDTYSKEEIIEKNIYDTIYTVTYEDAKANNFTISYDDHK